MIATAAEDETGQECLTNTPEDTSLVGVTLGMSRVLAEVAIMVGPDPMMRIQ